MKVSKLIGTAVLGAVVGLFVGFLIAEAIAVVAVWGFGVDAETMIPVRALPPVLAVVLAGAAPVVAARKHSS